MSLSANPFNVAYLPYLGQDSPNPRNTFYRRRAPTNSDRRLYKVGDRWIDTASQIAYILVGKTATTANWVQMSGSGGVTSLNGLLGALSIIDENALGAISVYVPGSGGPLTIGLEVNVDGVTIQRVGDQLVSTGASSFTVDAFTAPGTNPVVPLAGNIAITGTTVAAGVNPIRTNSIAANSFEIQAQISAATGATSPNSNGLSHFDSSHFTVNAGGYVQLIQAPFVWQDFAGGGLAASNGYFAIAAAAYTLPLGVVDGEIVEIVDQIGGGVVVTAAGGQFIQISNTTSSAGGTATSSQSGDGLRLVFRLSAGKWICQPGAAGNWLLA